MIGSPKQIINWLLEQDQTKDYECKRYFKKRSLDANAYCWVLCTKIADVTGNTKEGVYKKMLEDYAPQILVPVTHNRNIEGYFRYATFDCTTTINGVEADYYRVIKGSSDFDSAEMARFIDCIIQEAQALDIETMTPAEIMRLKEMWK